MKNMNMYRACGQHVNASDDKCTDLKLHSFMRGEVNQPKTHTPTPWNISVTNDRTQILDSAHFGPWKEVAKAVLPKDAAFIVRAVNAHEELLGALQFFVDAMTTCSDRIVLKKNEAYAVEKAKAIIAKAEGR